MSIMPFVKCFARISAFAFLLLSQAAPAQQSLRQFELHVGTVKTVPVGEVEKVAVGNESVLSVSPLDTGELLLIPREAGETDLFVWKPGQRMERFRVHVLGINPERRIAAAKSLLSGFPGLTVRAVNELVIVEGELDPYLMPTYTELLKGLQGVVSLVRPMETTMRDLIRIKVQVVEVDETYRKRVGIRWSDSIEGPTVAAVGTMVSNDYYRIVPGQGNVNWAPLLETLPATNKGFHPFVGFSSALLSSIHLMQQNGMARMMAEPVLTTRSGEEATFLSGGEIPYQTVDAMGNPSISFREYGIRLAIKPLADREGNIVSAVMAEVSNPDYGTASVGGVPALATRRTESVINARSGEMIVISGLLTTQDATTANRVPVLGDIPVISSLFRSKEGSEGRRELVILVTPEIVPRNVPAPDKIMRHAEEMRTIAGDGGDRLKLRE